MRFLIVVFLSTITINSNGQITNPFSSLRFDKVMICDFENDGEHSFPLVDEKGQLSNFVKKSVPLDQSTRSKLVSRLGNKKSYGQVHADCDEPHFGVIFYKGKKEAAEVQICLGCNVLSSTLRIPAQEQGRAGRGKNIYYNREGMSKQFRQFINELVRRYGFSHQIEPHSGFDN